MRFYGVGGIATRSPLSGGRLVWQEPGPNARTDTAGYTFH
jgi:hypothetical protein